MQESGIHDFSVLCINELPIIGFLLPRFNDQVEETGEKIPRARDSKDYKETVFCGHIRTVELETV